MNKKCFTYFWSCRIPKEKLRQLGAIHIYPAKCSHSGLVPELNDKEHEFIFAADKEFPTILKFACDENVVTLSYKHHRSISKGRIPKIPLVSDLSNNIFNLKHDMLKYNKYYK